MAGAVVCSRAQPPTEGAADLPPLDLSPPPEPAPKPVPGPPPEPAIDLDALTLGLNAPTPEIFSTVTESLTVQQAILRALTNNPTLKARRLDPEIGETGVRAALGRFDPAFRFSARYLSNDVPQNAEEFTATGGNQTQTQQQLIDTLENLLAELTGSAVTTPPSPGDPLGVNLYTQQNVLMSYSLRGLLPLGTEYEFFFNADQYRNDTNIDKPPSLFFPEYYSNAGIRLRQPLLQGFGPAAQMASVRLARADRRIGWLDWKQSLSNTLDEVTSAYYDLAFSFQAAALARQSIELAGRLEAGNRRRAELGRMSSLDVTQARAAVAEREVRLQSISAIIIQRMRALRELINAPDRIGELVDYIPTDGLRFEEHAWDRPAMLRDALTLRPEICKVREGIEKGTINVRYYRNQALPNLSAEATVAGVGLDGSYGSAISQASELQGTQVMFGVTLSVPLGNIKGRADLDRAKLTLQQTEFNLQQTEINIAADLDAAIATARLNRSRITTTARATALARKTLEDGDRLLDEGKVSSYDVLEYQSQFVTARGREFSAINDYQKSIVDVWRAQGIILDRFGILIEDEAERHYPKNPRRKIELPGQSATKARPAAK